MASKDSKKFLQTWPRKFYDNNPKISFNLLQSILKTWKKQKKTTILQVLVKTKE